MRTDVREGVGREVWEALAGVHDPEIPPCSITDLGIVERVVLSEQAIDVDLLPTFAGCPALDVIKQEAEAAVRSAAPGHDVRVRFVYSPRWTSDRITPAGRDALRSYGITPPGSPRGDRVVIPLAALLPTEGATCPFCGSANTVMESAFGPTLCRATHYCRACRNPFEAFKPKTA
ncbi:MAG: phenylacetate-CoA oxygenase subunit PaaJ [Actinobacteria bacterium]|nr:MAG: phenylacetate-CoA oxygenase subunit PaaJ [Actinomycetota bacterium]